MKNIPIPDPKDTAKCRCGLTCFISRTPFEADAITCPICEHIVYSEQGCSMSYCSQCRILFDIGCVHAVNGCTDNDFYGVIVSKWKYNDTECNGMVQLDSYQELVEKESEIEILEKMCTCQFTNCQSCPMAHYPNDDANYSHYEYNCV